MIFTRVRITLRGKFLDDITIPSIREKVRMEHWRKISKALRGKYDVKFYEQEKDGSLPDSMFYYMEQVKGKARVNELFHFVMGCVQTYQLNSDIPTMEISFGIADV